jgi:ribosomal protein L21E
MVTRLAGGRKRSRKKMKKSFRTRGKISLTRYFQEFKKGDSVSLKAEPAYQKGLYNLRFHNKVGVVSGKKGACYEVMIKDGGKPKKLIIHPVHLRRC